MRLSCALCTNCWMCLIFTLCISVKPRIFVKCSRLWSFVWLYFVLVLVLGPPVLVLGLHVLVLVLVLAPLVLVLDDIVLATRLPYALHVAQPTVSKHWREISHSMDLLAPSSPGGLPTLSLTTNSSWLPWGRVAMPLISLWCQYPSMMHSLWTVNLICLVRLSYLCQRGYVFIDVCLLVSLLAGVCKPLHRYSQYLVLSWHIGRGRNH